MNSDFTEIERIYKSPAYMKEEKKTAWGQFLDNYSAANSFSTKDEQLRQRATLTDIKMVIQR